MGTIPEEPTETVTFMEGFKTGMLVGIVIALFAGAILLTLFKGAP